MMAQHKFRSHGFECPPNVYQVLIISDIIVTSIFGSMTHLKDNHLLLVLVYGIFFYISLIFVVYYWVKASNADPTDPVVLANRAALMGNMPFDSSRYESMCTICSTSVGDNSKHCGSCNRCVERFDHHCIWLNNCIGKKNYKFFIKLIISLFIHELTILTASIRLIFLYFSSEGLENYYGLEIMAVEIFLTVQGAALGLFLLNLILLHLWLYKKGLTTYELIKLRSKKKKRIHSIGPTEIVNPKVTVPQSPKYLNDNN